MGRRQQFTFEDVCKHANEVTKSRGLGTLLLLLIERYRATRISEIPPDRYDEFIRRCIWLITDMPSLPSGDYRRTLKHSPEGNYTTCDFSQQDQSP